MQFKYKRPYLLFQIITCLLYNTFKLNILQDSIDNKWGNQI